MGLTRPARWPNVVALFDFDSLSNPVVRRLAQDSLVPVVVY